MRLILRNTRETRTYTQSRKCLAKQFSFSCTRFQMIMRLLMKNGCVRRKMFSNFRSGKWPGTFAIERALIVAAFSFSRYKSRGFATTMPGERNAKVVVIRNFSDDYTHTGGLATVTINFRLVLSARARHH